MPGNLNDELPGFRVSNSTGISTGSALSGTVRAANRYEKIVFVTKFGREYENTKVHPKSTILTSYGTECYRHSFPTVKANTRHLF